MYGGRDLVCPVACSQKPGNEHINAHRNAEQQVDHKIYDGGGAAHGCEARVACITPYNHDIRGVEKKLQDIGGHERQAEKQQVFQ